MSFLSQSKGKPVGRRLRHSYDYCLEINAKLRGLPWPPVEDKEANKSSGQPVDAAASFPTPESSVDTGFVYMYENNALKLPKEKDDEPSVTATWHREGVPEPSPQQHQQDVGLHTEEEEQGTYKHDIQHSDSNALAGDTETMVDEAQVLPPHIKAVAKTPPSTACPMNEQVPDCDSTEVLDPHQTHQENEVTSTSDPTHRMLEEAPLQRVSTDLSRQIDEERLGFAVLRALRIPAISASP